MTPKFAPVHLHWCLIFWTRGDPMTELGEEHFNSPVGGSTLQWMIDEKLIVWSADQKRYIPQDRLGVFIEHLCSQPLPIQQWVMPTSRFRQDRGRTRRNPFSRGPSPWISRWTRFP